VNAGDLIKFKCIDAGRTDSPPYSQDGEWRIGLLVDKKVDDQLSPFHMAYIFYRGVIVKALVESCCVIGDV